VVFHLDGGSYTLGSPCESVVAAVLGEVALLVADVAFITG
jgi:hypothetical protein